VPATGFKLYATEASEVLNRIDTSLVMVGEAANSNSPRISTFGEYYMGLK
jgi:hypothetical protein